MDPISEARLSQVIPELADKVRIMYASLMPLQIEIRVTQSLRTWPQQNADYAKGRTTPGPKVTNAPGGYSMHNFGLAVDCCPEKIWGQTWTPDWDGNDIHYARMVAAGEAQGLNCGADWHSFKDEPHFQVSGVPTTPTDAMRDDFSKGGLPLVWSNVMAGTYSETA